MLRASSDYNGDDVDLSAIKDPAMAGASGIAAAPELLGFASASCGGQAVEIASSRDALREALGDAAVVDSAAVIGNFERMTRIADGTGIPLDTPVNAVSAGIQDDLGLREFHSSEQTRSVGRLAAAAARLFSPIALRIMPRVAAAVRRAQNDGDQAGGKKAQ